MILFHLLNNIYICITIKLRMVGTYQKHFNQTPMSPSPSTTEMEQYFKMTVLPSTANPLNTWRKYQTEFPRLVKLAQKYLCIPASSAPVERLFTMAGKIIRPERCWMSDTVFEKVMKICCSNFLLRKKTLFLKMCLKN